MICLVLLVVNLGPSALAGFALFFFGSPLQTRVMRKLFAIRKKSMVFTDKRAKLLQEVFGNMRIIKLFAWEVSRPLYFMIMLLKSHMLCRSHF
jgi:hypothetical protein